jgi:hypothetical protein
LPAVIHALPPIPTIGPMNGHLFGEVVTADSDSKDDPQTHRHGPVGVDNEHRMAGAGTLTDSLNPLLRQAS